MPINTFSITIQNASHAPARFTLYLSPAGPPPPGPTPPSTPTQFANIWQTSPRLPSGDDSRVTFTLTDEYFAILGTSLTPMAAGVRPWTSSSVPVTLGPPQGSVACLTAPEDSPRWEPGVEALAAPGSFAIRCDGSFRLPNENNIWTGMGARDPRDPKSVIPVWTMTALPNFITTIEPKRKFYVTVGEAKKGTVVDAEKKEDAVLMVDFEGVTAPETEVVFTFTPERKYVPDEATRKSGIVWQS
ncbi:hypothetical protein MMC17_000141 [Xylographa soralifera]|nr:hypothetical protein [Xylographa soralifera]